MKLNASGAGTVRLFVPKSLNWIMRLKNPKLLSPKGGPRISSKRPWGNVPCLVFIGNK
jgi:hypothetical protein